jgi:hypothetical protein
MPAEVFWTAVCIGASIGLAISLTIQCFFLLTLNRALKAVAEGNRQITPRAVWLTIVINLIPVMGPIWSIYVVRRMAASIRREFEERGWPTTGEGFGRIAGLLWAWGALLYVPINVVQLYLQFSGDMATATMISLVSLPVALGLFACFIVYWVQMYVYGSRLREGHRQHASGSVEDDFDDRLDEFDRPRRRPGDEFDDDRPPRRDRD